MSMVSERRELASLSDLRSFPASWLPLSDPSLPWGGS